MNFFPSKNINLFINLSFKFLAVVALGAGAFFIYASFLEYEEGNKIALQEENIKLEEKIKDLEKQVLVLADGYKILQERPTEVVRREYIKERSQEELLTAAVAKVAPAVVSIVVSKDMPKLEVVYENPFGDDPFFKDFNVLIPRYKQKGTEVKKIGAGTGFLISSEGHIMTNRHVVDEEGAYYSVLLSDGSQKTANLLYKDAEFDLAILKIEGNDYSYVSLGDSDILKLGQSVFAIGNALGEYGNSVSVGIISGLHRDVQAAGEGKIETLKDVIQTDAAINLGNSGGPLVDLSGRVIGVNVATATESENIGFSIPINVVRNIVQPILNKN